MHFIKVNTLRQHLTNPLMISVFALMINKSAIITCLIIFPFLSLKPVGFLTNMFYYRFYSTDDPESLTSLDEYISRMKPDQDTILYLPGDTQESILKSPILKKYVKRGYEVLLLSDPIDEFCFQHLSEYEKRKVKSIAKDDVSLIDSGDEVAKKKL